MAQHLYPTMCKHTASERLYNYMKPHHIRKARHLQSTMLESTALKGLNTYNSTMHEAPHRKGLSTYNLTMHEALHQKGLYTYNLAMHKASHQKGHALTSDHGGTNPTIESKWPPVLD